MITRIELKNFRSVRHCSATLRPLTILIGANASGKSNIIKALGLLSSIAQNGPEAAVSATGGFANIPPKALLRKELGYARSRTSLIVEARLASPDGYPNSAPPLLVEYSIELAYRARQRFCVSSESLRFEEPLRVAACLTANREGVQANLQGIPPSSFAFVRTPKGEVKPRFVPRQSKQNLEHILSWLGLHELREHVTSVGQFNDLIRNPKSLTWEGAEAEADDQYPWAPAIPPAGSLLAPELRWPLSLCAHAHMFRQSVGHTRHYDLLLNELRQEQQTAASRRLSREGKHLPSATARLQSIGGDPWRRIMATLADITPQIRDTAVGMLSTGKNFVQFLEDACDRPVESWNAADGTLRALAILVALETHPEDATALIEEPELGLHPWAIEPLFDHIRQTIEARKIQVVLTTHSVQVLECAKPEEVLVTSRSPEDGTLVQPLSEIVPAHTIKKGEVGTLWVKGLLGGVPE